VRRSAWVFLIFAGLFAPGPAAALDCTMARTIVERDICRTPALLARDRAMTGLYGALFSQLPRAGQERLRSLRRGWLAGLKDCATRKDTQSCLAEAYDQQISALNAGKGHDTGDSPAIDLTGWRRELEAAGTLGQLTQAMDGVREAVAIPPDQMPSAGDSLTVDTDESAIAVGSPPGDARLVMIRASLSHEPERPEWVWLGVFHPEGDGTARLTAATQRVADVCGYADDHAFARDQRTGGLSFTEMLVSACGTYVETRTRDVGCFVTDRRLICLSGAVHGRSHFDRLPAGN
jgi:hypothetical protein